MRRTGIFEPDAYLKVGTALIFLYFPDGNRAHK